MIADDVIKHPGTALREAVCLWTSQLHKLFSPALIACLSHFGFSITGYQKNPTSSWLNGASWSMDLG